MTKKCESSYLVENNVNFNKFNINDTDIINDNDTTRWNYLEFFNKTNQFRKVKKKWVKCRKRCCERYSFWIIQWTDYQTRLNIWWFVECRKEWVSF